MMKERAVFEYEQLKSSTELSTEDAHLLEEARNATKNAYAPYSKFHVGAAALLENGETITGSNQENASFPAGICAERVLLSSVSSSFPNTRIKAIAISCTSEQDAGDQPIAPCGICRQTLHEYEDRQQYPIRLILGGISGEVIVIEKSGSLLPLAFGKNDLNTEREV